MRTTLDLPQDKLDELVRLTGARSKTEAIINAVEQAICAKRREHLLGLAGQVAFAADYDLHKLRATEVANRRQQLGLD